MLTFNIVYVVINNYCLFIEIIIARMMKRDVGTFGMQFFEVDLRMKSALGRSVGELLMLPGMKRR